MNHQNFLDRFLWLLRHGGGTNKPSKHRGGRRRATNWREHRKTRRQIARASRRRNRKH